MTDEEVIKGMVEDGKTYKAIGEELGGITKQAVEQRLKKRKRNWKNDTWRSYKRHYYHVKVGKFFENCTRCQDASRTTLET